MLLIGQVLYDNGPRYQGRKVEVVRVEERQVICKCGPREVVIRRDCIPDDAEPRRSARVCDRCPPQKNALSSPKSAGCAAAKFDTVIVSSCCSAPDTLFGRAIPGKY
jgi:hypothetical protein